MDPIQTIKIGAWEVTGFIESRFALDGGAMFGVVPRIMWQKLLPPDEQNRVAMQANIFVVKTGTASILLDCGLGDALSDFDRKLYAPRGTSVMNEALQAIGTPPESITHVVLTHLHTDHVNGAVTGDPDGPTLRFPNAEFFVQADEWDDATHPDERTKAVYHPQRLQPLFDSGRLHLVEGDTEILPGVSVTKTGGHTRGHQGVIVTNGDGRFIYYGDILPSRFHLKAAYVAALDLFPQETMKVKRALLKDCCGTDTVIGFDHEVVVMFGRIVQKEKWLDVEPVGTAGVIASRS